MSTHKKEWFSRLFSPSVSESIARKSSVPSLFFNHKSKPFVNENDGSISINEILIPIDHHPPAQNSIDLANLISKFYTFGAAHLNVEHVLEKKILNPQDEMPELELPDDGDYTLRFEFKKESIHDEIIRVANEIDADLIVMSTEGHNGLLDVLYGSTSEKVLHGSQCPVLSVPSINSEYLPRAYYK